MKFGQDTRNGSRTAGTGHDDLKLVFVLLHPCSSTGQYALLRCGKERERGGKAYLAHREEVMVMVVGREEKWRLERSSGSMRKSSEPF